MSVVFWGVEKPKTCEKCYVYMESEGCCKATGRAVDKSTAPMWCPLEEISTKKLMEEFKNIH